MRGCRSSCRRRGPGRRCTGSSPSCTRSAGASPETASAETLSQIGERIPLTVHEVASGTPVFDWTVPMEWNIRDAYVMNAYGQRVVDFRDSNLHVVSYSTPVRARMQLEELKRHVFTIPDRPDWIPYRTSYYSPDWGFCMTQRQLESLGEGEYEVCIDSTLKNGSLSYGECYLPGQTDEEVLISCHVCHPSLCNDNLSGIAVATALARSLLSSARRYSYRFVFVPGTIGSITWLAANEARVPRIRHGLVLTGVGDAGGITYKKSRRGCAEIDRAVAHVLARANVRHCIVDFHPYGYDERQYCSPGFNLPVGCLMRTVHGTYPQYHTSADDLGFVHPEQLAESLAVCLSTFHALDNNRVYLNLNPKCEPQLGKRGLYRKTGGQVTSKSAEVALLWVLNLSDGTCSLLDIAERSGLAFEEIHRAAGALVEAGLLESVRET